MPEVSVIMPAFNSENTILESIKSVMQQSFDDWELIVIDDCSTDSTVSIVQEICKQDTRLRLLKEKKNGGPASARNMGMRASKGIFIAFLDADDLWRKDKLEMQLNYHHKHPNILVSHTNYRMFDKHGFIKRSKLDVFYKKQGALIPTLYYKNTIATLTVVLHRRIIDKIGFFNEELFGVEDHDYWLRIAEAGYTFGHLKDVLTKYRINEKGISKFSGRYKWNFKKLTKIRLEKSSPKYKSTILANHHRFLGVSYIKNSNLKLGRLYLLKSLSYSKFTWLSLYTVFILIKGIINNGGNYRNR